MKEKKVGLAPTILVMATWVSMVAFAPVYFLRGGLISGLLFILLPARLFGGLRHITESALNVIGDGIFVVLGVWLIYLVVLYIGLRFRSWPAYSRWLIACVIIFILTRIGFGPLTDTMGPLF